MWLESETLRRDYDRLLKEPLPWNMLDGKTVLVTGATGLIGCAVVNSLLYYGKGVSNPPRVLALVRNPEKAQRMLGAQLEECPNLKLVLGDVTKLPPIDGPVDYIIHAASQTASKAFVQQPVETITTTVSGTQTMLELCREKGCKGMVYLSSMEVYGTHPKGQRITEADVGVMVPTKIRNSYPLSKQLAECLCASYAAEYGTSVRMLRLAQTFGPGVPLEDKRVFAEIARCAMTGKDMVLRTTGESAHSYLYTMDAVSAILQVLLTGKDGEAYTAANEETYCSIAEMAELICSKLSGGRSKVVFDLGDLDKLGYPEASYLDLDTSKLQALGWKPHYDLLEMYQNMMETMK